VPVGLRLTPSLKATLEEFARALTGAVSRVRCKIVLEDHAASRKAVGGKPAGKRKS
jgi:hypothetical protein